MSNKIPENFKSWLLWAGMIAGKEKFSVNQICLFLQYVRQLSGVSELWVWEGTPLSSKIDIEINGVKVGQRVILLKFIIIFVVYSQAFPCISTGIYGKWSGFW